MELPKDIKDEIWDYCRLNDISDVNGFIVKMVKQGFTSEKFGSTPWDKPAEIKEVEVEKIVEKEVIKEVPVEVIKEVEKIVEKEVFVTDEEANLELKKQIEELEKTIESLNVSSGVMLSENNTLKRLVSESGDRNNELRGEIVKLKEELEAEKAKPKQEEENDIYGEKKGFFGSNISDLWSNNKKKK